MQNTFAQQAKREHFYMQLQGLYGQPIIYSDSLSSTLNTPFQSGNFRLGVQSNGERFTDQLYSFHQYGVGVFHANLNNKDTLGNPWAVYAFFNAPIFRAKKLEMYYDVSLGLGWNFSKFDLETNPKMDLVGSEVTAYFGLAMGFAYEINSRFTVDAGMNFIHFSNGAIQRPNKGMNLYAAHLGLSYGFNRPADKSYSPTTMERKEIPKIDKSNELDFTLAAGAKTTRKEYGQGPKYFAGSMMVDFYHRYHWVGKFGGGLDLLYDESIKDSYATSVNTGKLFALGAHLSHELIINKVSFLTQLGTYLYKGTPDKGAFFFHVGLKYYFAEDFYTSLTLKTANGFKADFVQLGMGYKLQFKK